MTAVRNDLLSAEFAQYNALVNTLNANLASLMVLLTNITADNGYGTFFTANEQTYLGTTETNGLTAALSALVPMAYVITTSAGTHGTVDPTGSVSINYGAGQTFTATPEALYEVDTWTLDSVVSQTGGDTYTISNVNAVHTLAVSFKLSA